MSAGGEDEPRPSRLRSAVRSEGAALLLLAALAAVTRLYQLGSFPYFPVSAPWVGSTVYPGLYTDEGARLAEIALFPHNLTAYEPSIQILLVKVSQFLLGQNYFADRLPSALASILTSLLIYFAAKYLYNSKVPALISGLYFVSMVPAVIYGRMIFYENLVGLFLAAMMVAVAQYEIGGGTKWLYLGALFSLLAVLSKEDGLFVPLFFTLWLSSKRESKDWLRPMIVLWLPMILAGVFVLFLSGSLAAFLGQWGIGTAGRELTFDYMVVQALPSAYDVVAGGYFKPEFWFIFAYVCLAALVVAKSRVGRILAEILTIYLVLQVAVWGMSPYEVVSVFPALALAAGGGIEYLARLGTNGGLAVYGGLYVPLVASLINSVALSYVNGVGVNYPLSIFRDVILLVPVLDWLALRKIAKRGGTSAIPLSKVVLVCFLGLLILGTPWLYSYYFLGIAI